ncbi:MAG: response regulator [Leptospirales bacterium]
MNRTILVIEDETDILTLLKHYLRQEHFEILTAQNGIDGLAQAKALRPDLILLDLMLPGLDGLSVNRSLKKDPVTAGIPVVILTAKADETDRIIGLELGADDYIVKPFNPKELLARIKAILRRIDQEHPLQTERYSFGGVELDIARHEAKAGNTLMDLTAKEFSLLMTLIRNAGRVLDRQTLLDLVWGTEYEGTDRTVDVHIRRLRKKMGEYQDRILTVKQIGYKFSDVDPS